MKVTIKYTQRLGDIIGCLPIAKHFSFNHEVFFQCAGQYHDLFELVDYCKPVLEAPDGSIVYDIEIWPNRYNDYRASGLSWFNFIYKDFPQVDTKALFDGSGDLFTRLEFPSLDLSEIKVAFPSQFSEQSNPKEILLKCPFKPNIIAVPPKQHGWNYSHKLVKSFKLQELPGLIRSADKLFTVNSSPTIIAGAVRPTNYYHLRSTAFGGQDDWNSPRQIKL
jgi:hypothetical protein